MMGAESVEYHRATVLGRVDDHPGRAMEYYASRGETPLVWGGSRASPLGLVGAVSAEAYEAVFGPGGARDPRTGERLVQTRRPGMEIVIAAHKSVAELGVICRAEDMHAIMDAERDATLAYLDSVTRQMGGRRGEAATATPTTGLIYAHTRHATSRFGRSLPPRPCAAGQCPQMKDEQGGWKAADTALWREHLHAATMVGRVAAARVAVELGYGIEADPGPSGRLGHWRIAGVPAEVMELHSKRAAQIEAECQRRGETSYRARSMAARTTRRAKGHEAEGELVGRWRAELAEAGWPVERLAASVDAARQARQVSSHSAPGVPAPWSQTCSVPRVTWPGARSSPAGTWSWPWPRTSSASTPRCSSAWWTGPWPTPRSFPWSAWPGRGKRADSLASVLARENAIAGSLARQLGRTDGPVASPEAIDSAIAGAEESLGARLSDEQRSAVVGICTSGRGAELTVGVAGAGKTTMLWAVAEAFERSGHQVLGTATSGQAARNLGTEAGISESRTLASLIWRLDHGQISLNENTVVVLDEVGMTDDVDLVRLTAYVESAGAKLVLTGDHHQLGPSAPGERSVPWWPVTPAPSTTWPRTAASTTPQSVTPWRPCATGTSAKPSIGTPRTATSTLWPAGTTPSKGRSRPGPLTPLMVMRQGCTPGAGPTWPSSTGAPGLGWKPPAGSRDRNWPAPVGPATAPATASSPWPRERPAPWSPRSAPQ